MSIEESVNCAVELPAADPMFRVAAKTGIGSVMMCKHFSDIETILAVRPIAASRHPAPNRKAERRTRRPPPQQPGPVPDLMEQMLVSNIRSSGLGSSLRTCHAVTPRFRGDFLAGRHAAAVVSGASAGGPSFLGGTTDAYTMEGMCRGTSPRNEGDQARSVPASRHRADRRTKRDETLGGKTEAISCFPW
jgi:hypothetical protein